MSLEKAVGIMKDIVRDIDTEVNRIEAGKGIKKDIDTQRDNMKHLDDMMLIRSAIMKTDGIIARGDVSRASWQRAKRRRK
jgi:hypothetical protein